MMKRFTSLADAAAHAGKEAKACERVGALDESTGWYQIKTWLEELKFYRSNTAAAHGGDDVGE